MRRLLRFLQPHPRRIDDDAWRAASRRVPWLAHCGPAREARLRELVEAFLRHKTVTPVGELILKPEDVLVLAILCCLPLLEFGAEGLHGWSQLLVYPDAFRAHRSHLDAAGVLHEWDDDLIGEAWEQGPLILSWADVLADLDEPDAGYCVAVHEMAHKIDALDGALDGTPPLPRDWQRAWARDFQRAFDAFSSEVERGRDTALDAYAAEAPEEFFAVCSEYHFSAPATLRAAMPDVAAHLERFYGAPLLGEAGNEAPAQA